MNGPDDLGVGATHAGGYGGLEGPEGGQDLVLPQNCEQESQDIQASANVDIIGLIGIDALRTCQDLLVGLQLQFNIWPNVGFECHLKK